MDSDPGQCRCDYDVDSEQDLYVVKVVENGPLWLARCDEFRSFFAHGLTADSAVDCWVEKLRIYLEESRVMASQMKEQP